MSNYLAIAAVTATLRNLLQSALNEELVGAGVTTVRPDADADLPATGANIFLFQAVPNAAWRNADLPTRSRDGRLVQRPVTALDLHYLLTFYGSEGDLEPQRALGIVARTLHAQPVLTPDVIQAAIDATAGGDPNHYLLEADLQAEAERVALTPLPFTLEELSKLWSVLFQTPYALSMAYLASVVRIEAEETPQRALPVRVRGITALPFRRATVERVVVAADERLPVVMGETARLLGSGLGGSIAFVRVGPAELHGGHQAGAAGAGADPPGGNHRVEPRVAPWGGIGPEAEALAQGDEGDPALVCGAGVGGQAHEVGLLGRQSGGEVTVDAGGAEAGQVEGQGGAGRSGLSGPGRQECSSHRGTPIEACAGCAEGKGARSAGTASDVSLAGGGGGNRG